MTPKFKSWHFVVLIACMALTGCLGKNLIPEGKWHDAGTILLGILQYVGVMSAQNWQEPTPAGIQPIDGAK